MILEQDMKLDFDDVLFKPQRSTLSSRKDVDIRRRIVFRNSKAVFDGVPIIAANMDSTGTFEMGSALAQYEVMTAIHKHYSLEDWKKNAHMFFENYMAVSIGTKDEDYDKFLKIQSLGINVRFLVIDVANGYSEKFINFVSDVRKRNPHLVIMAGNVVSSDITQELILNGADVVKVGIGPGCFTPGTKVQTKNGIKNIEDIVEGEEVITHKGNWQKVTNAFQYKENEKIVSVNGIKSTSHHEYYVLNKKYKDIVDDYNIHEYAEWIEAGNLDKEKYFLLKHK